MRGWRQRTCHRHTVMVSLAVASRNEGGWRPGIPTLKDESHELREAMRRAMSRLLSQQQVTPNVGGFA